MRLLPHTSLREAVRLQRAYVAAQCERDIVYLQALVFCFSQIYSDLDESRLREIFINSSPFANSQSPLYLMTSADTD